MLTISELRAMLDSCADLIVDGDEFSSGNLEQEADPGTKPRVPYKLFEGWSPLIANACDKQWGEFNERLLEYIRGMNLASKELDEALENIQLDDSHWRWLNKSIAHRGDAYRWFFMVAEEKPQAACLIYHPKDSAIDGEPIFYIEYVAVAPWNRKNPMEDRHFKGVGSAIVRSASDYAITKLGLRPGYCLHALPKAIPFYESLGMKAFPNRDKDNLPYYELPEEYSSMPGESQ
jgi:GNAT superfamily N-acetyltransferase